VFQCPEGHWFLFYETEEQMASAFYLGLLLAFQCPEGHWFLFYLKQLRQQLGDKAGFSAPKGIGFFSTAPDILPN
jgi:hypothetical protein